MAGGPAPERLRRARPHGRWAPQLVPFRTASIGTSDIVRPRPERARPHGRASRPMSPALPAILRQGRREEDEQARTDHWYRK